MTTPPATTPTKPALPTIQSTSHISQLNVSVLYQGPPGEGKTTYALSWPNPFVLYFDKNLGTLRDFPGIPFVTPQTWQEVDQVWIPAIQNRRLTELVQGFVDDNGQHPYPNYKVRTLVIDSFTNFVNMNVLELGDGGAKSLGYDGWDTYYGRINRLMTATTASAIYNPKRPTQESYHVVGTIHEDNQRDEKGNLTGIKPSVQGKMANHFTSYWDTVLLTDTSVDVVEVPSNDKSKPATKSRLKNHFVWATDPSPLRKSKVSREFAKLLPRTLAGDFATINKYIKLEGPVDQ